MACHLSFAEYVRDQISGAGNITFRKMFGEWIQPGDGRDIARQWMAALVALAVLALSGCASTKDPVSVEVAAAAPKGRHKLEPGEYLQYRSCDFQSWTVREGDDTNDAEPGFHRTGYSSMHTHPKDHLATASRTFHYAMMASNV